LITAFWLDWSTVTELDVLPMLAVPATTVPSDGRELELELDLELEFTVAARAFEPASPKIARNKTPVKAVDASKGGSDAAAIFLASLFKIWLRLQSMTMVLCV